jgi:beta-phosphoglucomutase-like phosphatase (HAD superfamily)
VVLALFLLGHRFSTANKRRDADKKESAPRKNRYYVEFIATLTPTDLLPGIADLIEELRSHRIQTALASASRPSTRRERTRWASRPASLALRDDGGAELRRAGAPPRRTEKNG